MAAVFKPLRDDPETMQPPATCGKICSYDFDFVENGKYYPMLYKFVDCPSTFYSMAHSPYLVVLPPPRQPPPNLLRNFTIDGQCPVAGLMYFDESSVNKKRAKKHFSAQTFRKLLERENVSNINTYRDKNTVKPALMKYKHIIEGKRVAVIGTLKPWAEAMLLNLGAGSVTTIEYTPFSIEHEKVTTITPYHLAEHFMNGSVAQFDTAFTYSSMEHSGLGRYGDPITPFGDLEAAAQVWCMVKPGGHFILAVPVSNDRVNCSIIWNAHRIYGDVRLQHLTANWHVLDEIDTLDRQKNHIFVLLKAHM